MWELLLEPAALFTEPHKEKLTTSLPPYHACTHARTIRKLGKILICTDDFPGPYVTDSFDEGFDKSFSKQLTRERWTKWAHVQIFHWINQSKGQWFVGMCKTCQLFE